MKRKIVTLVIGMSLLLSLTACSQSADEVMEETHIVEEVSAETAEEETESTAITEEATEEETETTTTTEETPEKVEEDTAPESTEADISDEEAMNISHTYKWGIMEFGGEYSMVISIVTQGIPSAENSKIDFYVAESVFDYKIFTEVKCGNELVLNKDNQPNWVDSVNGGNGIMGFVGDGFALNGVASNLNENGEFQTSFCYTGDIDGALHEYTVVWKADGSLAVNTGNLTEQ